MHINCNPSILYFGTPVVLLSTVNENGSYNLAPISSVFWLGYRCVIGIAAQSKTTENILRTGECVLNLPSVNEAAAVNRLALKTGSDPVPASKVAKGYHYEPAKFEVAGLNAAPADLIKAPLVKECPVQLEAKLASVHPLAVDNGIQAIKTVSFELKIVQVHVESSILMDGRPNRIDPDKWRPLIMSFQEFYGLGEKIQPSTLARVPEILYRTADTELAAHAVRF
jgi:flavin reductase (DIM6/NTAB) family NADH-FMN oxidoreductase RutF